MVGLSPRVRGSPKQRGGRPVPVRSIPACAGEPSTTRVSSSDRRVYPRVCGGAHSRSSRKWSRRGLSPRVRGSPEIVIVQDAAPRSIPACAGEPLATGLQDANRGVYPACAGEPAPAAWDLPAPEVYPRVCGGANRLSVLVRYASGLSPRVRGSQDAAADHWQRRVLKVYPRVCGGAQSRQRRLAAWPQSGSIPACAGEPRLRELDRQPRFSRVYPRVCGGA